MPSELKLVLPTQERTTCIVCDATLGQESRDLSYLTCHAHRTCIRCQKELSSKEVQLCIARFSEEDTGSEPDYKELELKCARCLIVEKAITQPSDTVLTIKQSDYDLLNLVRLMVTPNMDLSINTNEKNAMIQSSRFLADLTWDEKYAHLKMMEACVAQASLALAQDRKQLKARADEREAAHFKKAQREALTSSRPTPAINKATEESEVLLGEFMKKNGIQSREVAKKLKRDRDKAILALIGLGIPEALAQSSVDADLVKRGLLK